MRTQLCFVLPGVEAAHKVEKELRLARTQDRHMHFMISRFLQIESALGLGAVLLFALLGPSAQASGDGNGFQCPSEDIIATQCKGPKDCLYANPDDCGSFIQCVVNPDGVTGRPVVMPCPAGLHWNSRDKICDWPVNEDCGNPPEEP